MSTKIVLEGLHNTRDLEGMICADGLSVRPGMLIRSGHLYHATDNDIHMLSDLVSVVVDFRSGRERDEKPDPEIPGTISIHLPIVENLEAGISRDRASDNLVFAMVSRGPAAARQYMIRMYEHFVTNDFCIAQYRRFIRLLMEPREKAFLWHCTAGKDRAGFAAVIVQEMLGMDREIITADYLQTNKCLETEVQSLMQMAEKRLNGLTDNTRAVLDYAFGAYEDYLDALYDAVQEQYGSFTGFIQDGLGITPAECEQFRKMYLR